MGVEPHSSNHWSKTYYLVFANGTELPVPAEISSMVMVINRKNYGPTVTRARNKTNIDTNASFKHVYCDMS